jgi:hypothetical protein
VERDKTLSFQVARFSVQLFAYFAVSAVEVRIRGKRDIILKN